MSPDQKITLIPPFPIFWFLTPFPYLPDTLYTTDTISRCMLSMIGCTGLCRYVSVRTFSFYSPFPLLHDHWHLPTHYIRLKSSSFSSGTIRLGTATYDMRGFNKLTKLSMGDVILCMCLIVGHGINLHKPHHNSTSHTYNHHSTQCDFITFFLEKERS